ncbi:hypothetical protein [Marivirga sp.]|uniref:hypothetical protein n=1 Tax=Marivirga sp. TaxID=2018662 RepID=UPI002D7E8722|nr:hypothetical protein [Marivirga sp.]HET8860490.1 hypothetical protein [Marivirga sp.]
MRRFFTTFFLLSGVAFSLIISDNYSKQQKEKYAANNTQEEFYKSIDLTDADIYNTKRNNSKASFTN